MRCYYPANTRSGYVRDPLCDQLMSERFAGFWGDQNADGLFTVTDVGKIVGRIFYLPGDFAITLLYPWDRVGAFLELSPESYGGYGSGAVSVLLWLMLLGILAAFGEG